MASYTRATRSCIARSRSGLTPRSSVRVSSAWLKASVARARPAGTSTAAASASSSASWTLASSPSRAAASTAGSNSRPTTAASARMSRCGRLIRSSRRASRFSMARGTGAPSPRAKCHPSASTRSDPSSTMARRVCTAKNGFPSLRALMKWTNSAEGVGPPRVARSSALTSSGPKRCRVISENRSDRDSPRSRDSQASFMSSGRTVRQKSSRCPSMRDSRYSSTSQEALSPHCMSSRIATIAPDVEAICRKCLISSSSTRFRPFVDAPSSIAAADGRSGPSGSAASSGTRRVSSRHGRGGTRPARWAESRMSTHGP